MFDIGFTELLLIAVVALIVLGPERLPKAARFAGLWVRRARAQWSSVKAEFERDLANEELKRSLDETKASLRDMQASLRDAGGAAQREFDDARDEVMRGPPLPAITAAEVATPRDIDTDDATTRDTGTAAGNDDPPADADPAQAAAARAEAEAAARYEAEEPELESVREWRDDDDELPEDAGFDDDAAVDDEVREATQRPADDDASGSDHADRGTRR